ncbi:MAG: C40 family peptidase [Muribaculaceae bacterium]|nr:C40 family peptidase [Muribaculaceae bacterium]
MKKILFVLTALLMTLQALAITANDLVSHLKDSIAPDGRTAVWDVKVAQQGKNVSLSGTVTTQAQADAIVMMLKRHKFDIIKNSLTVLEKSQPANKQWGLVCVSVASLRTQGKHSAEMATQLVMGSPVHVLETSGDWLRVQGPDDYISYIPVSSVKLMGETQLNTWKQARRFIVTVYDTRLVEAPGSDETVSDLVLGDLLELVNEQGDWVLLTTPDGRKGWVEKSSVEEFATWAQQEFDVTKIEKTARRMMGSGYLWGGTSTKVTDCSGMTKVSYFSNAIILQRDASQQTLTGLKIDTSKGWSNLQAGDLLFFGNAKTGRVTHVGLYLRDGNYIHCSGRVKINSLDPNNATYLYSPLSASRIAGMVGTTGIVAVKNHPWYF